MSPRHFCTVLDIAIGALDPTMALDFVSEPGFGGVAMFVGRVRDLNRGRAVTGVSYDMHEGLALKGFQDIAKRIEAELGPQLRLYVAHAKGRLSVGGLAVVIAAGTPHRDEAFRACRQAIETVKHTIPIWKQEHYADGSSAWSEGCSLCDAVDQPATRDGHDHSAHHQ